MNNIDKQQDDIWKKIDPLILTKKPKDYDETVRLLVDLSDLAKKNKTTGEFKARLLEIKSKHNRKPILMSRMDSAGL